jgi:hypothetical protein
MKERTLSIVKPDAVQKNAIGEILRRFENAGLKIVAAKMIQLSKAEAQGFYAVHKERPFFESDDVYVVWACPRLRAGRRRRHPNQPSADGRNQPSRSRCWHDSQRLCDGY